MELTTILEWSGAYTGLAGAALLSLNCRYSAYGWILFLISNISWIWFASISDIHGLQLQHFGFMATSLLGVWRWIFRSNQSSSSPATSKKTLESQ